MFVALFKRVHGSEMGFALFAREARFGRYRNISSESIVPDYTLCCLVLSTKPATRSQYIQKFELIAPIQTVFWFIFWDKRNFVLS